MKKKLLIGLALSLTIPLLCWLVIGNVLGSRWEKVAVDEWKDAGGLGSEFESRFPPTTVDEPTKQLEQLTAALGIDLIPKHVDDARSRPERAAIKSYKDFRGDAYDWLYAALETGDDRQVAAAPASTRAWLAEHEGEIAALEDHALNMESLARWEGDIKLGGHAPLPNLLGAIQSQKLLNTVAFSRLQAGDSAGAERAVLTSWRLNQALRKQPFLISQLIYIAGMRIQVGVLRRLAVDAGPWEARFAEHDLRVAFLASLQAEVYAAKNLATAEDLTSLLGKSSGTSLLRGLPRFLVNPYLRMAASDYSAAMARAVKALQTGDACTAVLRPDVADMEASIPGWNVVYEIMLPNIPRAWNRYVGVQADLELTLLVLRTREAGARDGSWPATIPAGIDSVCPSESWSYALASNGSPVISYSGEAESKRRGALALPTTHSFGTTAIEEPAVLTQ